MWEFLDKIIYINLDHREDRRILMKQLFQQGNIPDEKIYRFSAIYNDIGAVGASQSHLAAVRLAKQNNWNTVLILEDDIEWKDFETNYTQLETLMTQPWDVCMLGGAYVDKEGLRIKIAYSGYSYIVRSHYYDTLIHNFQEGLTLKLNKPKNNGVTHMIRNLRYNYLVKKDTFHSFDSYWMKLQWKDSWIGISMCGHVHTYSNVSNSNTYENIQDTVTTPEFKTWIADIKLLLDANQI